MATMKLFNLKKWLNIPDAARHLSLLFDEDVTQADVLQLFLDGYLTLSVQLINDTLVRRGRVVDADTEEGRVLSSKLANERRQAHPLNFKIDDDQFLTLENEKTHITGVWDLAMFGTTRTEIQQRYQELTNGPDLFLGSLDGCFLYDRDDSGYWWQLQDPTPHCPHDDETIEILRRLRHPGLSATEIEKYTETFLKKQQEDEKRHPTLISTLLGVVAPVHVLPESVTLVVRTEALKTFEETHAAHSPLDQPAKGSLEGKYESLLKLVYGMSVAAYRYDSRLRRNTATGSKRGSIAYDLDKLGLKIDNDTVRKRVEEGFQVFGHLSPRA